MTEPVQPLRALRKRALRVNQICSWWSVTQHGDPTATHHAALVAWRLARVVTGWLYTLPNRREHPVPSLPAELAIGVKAAWIALQHASDDSRLAWLSREMHDIYRDTVKVRALTASPEINDMLARHQPALRAVLMELGEQAQRRGHADARPAPPTISFPSP